MASFIWEKILTNFFHILLFSVPLPLKHKRHILIWHRTSVRLKFQYMIILLQTTKFSVNLSKLNATETARKIHLEFWQNELEKWVGMGSKIFKRYVIIAMLILETIFFLPTYKAARFRVVCVKRLSAHKSSFKIFYKEAPRICVVSIAISKDRLNLIIGNQIDVNVSSKTAMASNCKLL